MGYKCYVEKDINRWDLFNEKNSKSFFVNYTWNCLISDELNIEFMPVVIEDDFKKIQICIFKDKGNYKGTVMGYGGIVSNSDNISFQEVQRALKDKLDICLENYMFNPSSKMDIPDKNIKKSHTYLLSLNNNFNEIWDGCSGKARTAVRYARKNSIEIKRISLSEVNSFYSLYKKEQLRKEIEILTKSFFIDLITEVDDVIILGAFKDGDLVSASIFMYDKSTLYYWMNINSQKGRKFQASYLILYKIIEKFCGSNCNLFDMGYSHNDNISRPKIYWGAKKITTYIYGIKEYN